MFWKTIKPLFSDELCIRYRIFASTQGGILKTESERTETLNNLFSNIVKNLNVSRYSEPRYAAENITKPTIIAILK